MKNPSCVTQTELRRKLHEIMRPFERISSWHIVEHGEEIPVVKVSKNGRVIAEIRIPKNTLKEIRDYRRRIRGAE